MMKKVAVTALVSTLSIVGTTSSVFAQSSDSDIDSIINGLVNTPATTTTTATPTTDTTATTTTTTTTTAVPTVVDTNFTSTTAEGVSLEAIANPTATTANSTATDSNGVVLDPMLEPDDGAPTVDLATDLDGLDINIDDVMLEPTEAETATAISTSNSSVASPRKVTSTQRLSAAGMDSAMLIVAGLLASGGIALAMRRRK